jgi:magnesium transporter
MFDLIGGRGQKAGMGPGSMVYIGEAGRAPVRLELIEYDGARFEERTLGSLDDWAGPQPDAVAWLNVTGVHDARVLEAFGSRFGRGAGGAAERPRAGTSSGRGLPHVSAGGCGR